MERLLVVSPHLDDAVLGCGELLALHPGAVAVTVCAGVPDEAERVSEWDASCGFASGREAALARRREDRAALAELDASPCWLPYPDLQYQRNRDVAGVSRRLAGALRRFAARIVALPLGLSHHDHRLASDAALALHGKIPGISWLLYEEALYRRYTEHAEERRAQLRSAGFSLEPLEAPRSAQAGQRKAAAVQRYASQVPALRNATLPFDDVFAPERYWKL
jgi:LmbE family N-acetylglucosaminyl deacetylase